jgi:sugar phosphate isomerase/epimerase
LRKSIAELAPTAARLKTPFQIEAINRFESPLGRSLDEAWDLVGEAANEYTWILPDTWHMNIEESNMEAAMVRHRAATAPSTFRTTTLLPRFGASTSAVVAC